MAPLSGLIAHGGVGGAVVEALVALAVISVLLAVWLRERRVARGVRENLNDEDSTPS